jgi:hypothetical protein
LSLHEELDLLARAGLTPLEVLQAATLNPAEVMGRTADAGAVEPGKIADLLLFDGDPTRSTTALHPVSALVLHGRLLDCAALDQQLRAAAALAEGSSASTPSRGQECGGCGGLRLRQSWSPPLARFQEIGFPAGKFAKTTSDPTRASRQIQTSALLQDQMSEIWLKAFPKAPTMLRAGALQCCSPPGRHRLTPLR